MEHLRPLVAFKPQLFDGNPISFEQQFYFVDPSDSQSRRSARSHMVTERFRELRWRSKGRVRVDSRQKNVLESSKAIERLTAKPSNSDTRRRGQRIKFDKPKSSEKGARDKYTPRIAPCIPGDLDTFQTLPVLSSPEVRLLVHHYTNVIPSLLCSTIRAGSLQHQPVVDLFYLYRLHPASFLGMLYHSARHRESLYQDGPEKCLSLTFKIKTLQEVNRLIDKAAAKRTHPDDGTIMAIYLLSVAERMWGDLNIFRLHWRAMYDIIDARGGAEGFADDDLMFAKICWNCFALLNARDGYFNCPRNPLAASANYDFKIPADCMISNCHHFLQVYADRKAAVLRSLPTTEAEALFQLEAYPRRMNAFQPLTMLHRILRLPGNGIAEIHSHIAATESAAQSCLIQILGDRLRTENCQLACIIYINLLLLELGDFSDITERFLSSLEEMVTKNMSPEYLLWILLRNPIAVSVRKSRELWMKAIQIIAVVKRARYQSVLQYHEAMLLLLELPADMSKLAPALKVDLATIQEEALGHASEELTTGLYFDHPSPSNSMVTSQTFSELLWFAGPRDKCRN